MFVSSDDWIFGGNAGNSNGFYQHLGKAEKDKRDYSGFNRQYGNGSRFSGGGSMNRDEIFDPSSDGVNGKLKEAALLYKIDDDEDVKDGYSFRPDGITRGFTYPRVWFLTTLIFTLLIT